MIKSIHHTCTGTEVDPFYVAACSGKEIIEVLINGSSYLTQTEDATYVTIDNEYGLVNIPVVEKGDLIQVVYKTNPGTYNPVDNEGDFLEADFLETDFYV